MFKVCRGVVSFFERPSMLDHVVNSYSLPSLRLVLRLPFPLCLAGLSLFSPLRNIPIVDPRKSNLQCLQYISHSL